MTMQSSTGVGSGQDLSSRIVRYADLKPCFNAFVDSRTPGSDAKENFTVIGPGVSENPNQYVHIAEPHGFNIGGARQPPGCLNSQHSHDTAEVFVVHTGKWRFQFGVDAADGFVELEPGDTISIPTKMFRGFENIGEDTGYLFAVLGGDDPGKVVWAPSVFELADKYGLILLKGGQLIDTTLGDIEPPGSEHEIAPTSSEVASLATPDSTRLDKCVARFTELEANSDSALAASGISESAVITPVATSDRFSKGPISGWWPHGFNLRKLQLDSGSTGEPHHRSEAEVIFVHQGALSISWQGQQAVLQAGDTLSIPALTERQFSNHGEAAVQAFVVRGGDSPALPTFKIS